MSFGIALWFGVRASSTSELCVRGFVFCGIPATIMVIGLVVARLKDPGYISSRVVAGIFTMYALDVAASAAFILLGLISRAIHREYTDQQGSGP
jgi:hypothetical protein